jgi:hypothetical protein
MGNRKCRHCGKKNDERDSYFPRHVPKYKMAAFCNSEHFDAFLSSQIASGELVKKGDAIRRTESNKAHREAKAKLKTRSQWLKGAQIVFNRFIRLRDEGDSCISCGRNTGAKMNAGHYKSVGSTPALRFNEDNVISNVSIVILSCLAISASIGQG